ncbi:unnamed protein product, partial [Prunus brigantina]
FFFFHVRLFFVLIHFAFSQSQLQHPKLHRHKPSLQLHLQTPFTFSAIPQLNLWRHHETQQVQSPKLK